MEFIQGSDAAYIIDADTVNEAVVQGLTEIGNPGRSRTVIDLMQLRDDHGRQIAGGVRTEPIPMRANMIPDDYTGQAKLRQIFDSKEVRLTDRIAINDEDPYDFWAPDLAQDPDMNGWQCTKDKPGSNTNDKVVETEFELIQRGKPALYTAHTTDDMTVTKGTGSDEDTIVRAAGSFVTDGFVAGMSMFFVGTGAGANAGHHYIILTVAALTITLTTIGSTTAVSSAAEFTIHGGF
jgi:hypothetical protein